MVGEHQGGNYSQNFTHYSILVFLMDVTIIPKIDTIIYSQCDHLNTENTTVFDLPRSFCNIHTMTVFALGTRPHTCSLTCVCVVGKMVQDVGMV